MQITSDKMNERLTVFVSGRVDAVTAPELEQYINNHLSGVSELILDLKEMSYTSSAGLRVFLKAQKAMNRQGSMKVVNVQSDVMDVLEMTGFSDILTIE